jgi:hypothetical protein
MPKEPEAKSYFDEARTLTGLTLREAGEALKVDFPQSAIKKREGSGGDLSSINTYYEIERLNEVFGLCGVGWWYEIADLTTVENVVVAQVNLFFRWDDGKEWLTAKPIPSKGQGTVRKGMSRGDAEKSAITDALTKAASLLGVGLSVFKGEQTHRTRETRQRDAQRKADTQSTEDWAAQKSTPQQPSDVIERSIEPSNPAGIRPNPHYNGKESDAVITFPGTFKTAPKSGKSLIYKLFDKDVVFPIKHVVGHSDNEVCVTAWIANKKHINDELPLEASRILLDGTEDRGDSWEAIGEHPDEELERDGPFITGKY